MAKITPLTSDTVTGSDTVTLKEGEYFGGFDLNCDGSNAGSLTIRDNDASGRILVKTSSLVGKVAYGPIPCSGTIHYTVAGTGASAFLYEWQN